MKLKLIVLIIFITNNFIFSNILLKEKDNIFDYLKKYDYKFKIKEMDITNWKGCKLSLYYYKEKYNHEAPFIIKNEYDDIIGILQYPNQYKDKKHIYIIDLDGDGILDKKSQSPIVSYWVVKKHSLNETKNNNIKYILDMSYNNYQSDNPSYDILKKINFEIMSFSNDENMENRDLFYLLFLYFTYCKTEPYISYKYMNIFNEEYNKRFNDNHNLVLLFRGESFINYGALEWAKEDFIKLLEKDKDYIPAKFYLYMLEDNKVKKNKLYKDLKKNHPNHWLVKKIK